MSHQNALAEADIEHRLAFKSYVFENAEAWHRNHLGRLYSLWESWNAEFFDGQMLAPYILLSVPNCARAIGDCSKISAWGGRSQIRIRPSLLTGSHRAVRAGDCPELAEGRLRYGGDVLLHEMIHQYQMEVSGQVEKSYKGHGPSFSEHCNRIGARLGLHAVRSAKKRGKGKRLPSCAYWPQCVRPSDYYLGAAVFKAVKPMGEDDVAEPSGGWSGRSRHPKAEKLDSVLAQLAAAAEEYVRVWPVGSEAEAAAAYTGGWSGGRKMESAMEQLCVGARAFCDALSSVVESVSAE